MAALSCGSRRMTVLVLFVGFYAIVFAVLVIGIALGFASWVIGVIGFVLLFSFAMGLVYRAARKAAPPPRGTDG